MNGGKYRIIRYISSGGFGCTYEAWNIEMECNVAIKEFYMKDFCNRDSSSGHVTVATQSKVELVNRVRRKFTEEAQALFRMNHPNIVRVTDKFEENGTAYYVMDYVEGNSLAGLLAERGPLPEDEAIGYIRQAASALDYVHNRNRLHLDVKPANIMVDSASHAVLIDFGVSKQYDEVAHENTSTLMGSTPGYAPPEQMSHSVGRFTPATDIYALGATLYKLLTGITPVDASLRSSGEELDPLPQTISASVRHAVEASMRMNKNKRPQSIKEFLGLVESEETEIASDETNLSMGTGQNAANGNAAVEENEIEVEVVETPSVAPEPAPRPQPEENQKKNKFLWIIILLAVICGAAVGFMLFGGGSDIKKDSAKDTAQQIAQQIHAPIKETKDTPTIQTDKKDTTAQPQPVAPIPVAEQTTQLKIKGAPNGAYVYVDGNYFDETPLKDATISIGRHTIKVVKEGYESYEKTHTFTSQTAPINLTLTAKPKPQPQNKGIINGHEYVDLGLSVKWATCNVGASKPEEYGNYYAWGETSTKSNYSSDNSVTYGKNFSDIGGNPTYDVARKQWGSTWRLPTKAEFDELLSNCTWTWTTQNGIKGCKVTSKKNGNSIFLPAAGWRNGSSLLNQGTFGGYWSSTPHESYSGSAFYLDFSSGGHSTSWGSRLNGRSVRPVCK